MLAEKPTAKWISQKGEPNRANITATSPHLRINVTLRCYVDAECSRLHAA